MTSTLGERARFTRRAIPSPKGRTSIDEKTGDFTYEPSPEDADEFAVWIRARAGAKEESQKVYITPHPQVPSDFNVIEHVSGSAPDPASRFYTTFSQEDADKAHFNRKGLDGDPDKTELGWPLLANELAALAQRLKGPYDYFGNPAGWVLMLSFQANYTLFETEMESAVRAMFLAYWIQNTQARAQAAATMLKAAREHIAQENDRALADYRAAELKVATLTTEMASIAEQIEDTRKRVASMKEELTRQVKEDLKTEHALRASAKILGGVMQLIPVGQPVLGSFGQALTVLGDIDVDKPAASLGGMAGAFAPVMTEVLQPKVEARAAKESIIGGFSKFAVSEDDVKEQLEKVLAETPDYGEAVKAIESLNERKKSFAEELHATIQAIDRATTTNINNQLAILDLRDQQDRKLEQLNLEALQSVQDMGRRARERLLLYQYYLLKSYHYLMLEDMPAVDFRAQKLFDAFSDMVIEKQAKAPSARTGCSPRRSSRR